MDNHGVQRSNKPRTEEKRLRDAQRIAEYRALDAEFRRRAAAKDFALDTFATTTRLLYQNPEYYTAWNVRRRCLLAGQLRPPPESPSEADDPNARTLEDELAFTVPLLLAFPKSYWIWNHRGWALEQCISRLPRRRARAVWENELALTGQMLWRDQRNFHAWGYRREVVARLLSEQLVEPVGREPGGEGEVASGRDGDESGERAVASGRDRDGDGREARDRPGTDRQPKPPSLMEQEFEFTMSEIKSDLSNFSAWHRRAELIVPLLEERRASAAERRAMLDEELDLARRGLDVGPDDQSIWYYHHLLMLHLLPTSTAARLPAAKFIAPDLSLEDRLALGQREVDAVRELLDDFPPVKLVFEGLIEYVLALAEMRSRAGGGSGDGDDGAAAAAGRLTDDERDQVTQWIAALKKMDPMRSGRWDDLAKRADRS